MIRTLTTTGVEEEINADFEFTFTADSGSSTIIPIGRNWHTVGIQLSGGLDSALLLFLTAKAIKELKLNIKIQPITMFIPTKVKNIISTKSIVSKVSEILNVNLINDVLLFEMPFEDAKDPIKKDKFFIDKVRKLTNDKKINFHFNGNTKNPPEEIRQSFINDDLRQKNRDCATSIYNSSHGASPHYGMNKQDIINLYIKHNLINDLAPLTISCDENIWEIHNTKSNVPCGTCWWCSEREWGFESNNVKDPAKTLSYQEYLDITNENTQ